MPIDLAAPRVFAFEEGKRKFTLTTKPITQAMWLEYFGGIISTDERLGDGSVESTFDSAGARVQLLEAALTDAAGYTPEGTTITGTAGWQSKLPMRHRAAVANLLTSVRVVPAEDDSFELGFETVMLAATWTANAEGRMQEVTGLRHTFLSPTADQQKRYSRANSRSVITGDSRTAQTRYLGFQDVLIEIYDELIEKIGGYDFGDGKDFLHDDIVRKMDSYHKVVAAGALFAPAILGQAVAA